MQIQQEDFLTLTETAKYLGVSVPTVRKLLLQNRLSGQKLKHLTLVSLASAEGHRRWREGQKGKKMSLIAEQNLFQGINPILMSLYQLQGWGMFKGFHNTHIVHLADAIDIQLPAGYRAYNDDTLKIRRQFYDGQLLQFRNPDVSIRSTKPSSAKNSTNLLEPDLRVPLAQLTPPSEDEAVIIYREDPQEQESKGQAVVVIELLSPTNKISEAQDYQHKRLELFQLGIVLVELDYLHETPSPIPNIPAYPDGDGSTPYYIALSNPHQEQPTTDLYRFGINQKIPTLRIPLLGDDSVMLDFDAVYQFTVNRPRFCQDIDYSRDPIRIERYSETDQNQIRTCLLEIQKTLHGR